MDRAGPLTIYDHLGQPVRLDRPDDLAVPHILTFTGVYRGAYRTYFREKFDEAMRHSRENALAMRLDEHLQACLNERVRGVANLDWHLAADNPKDPRQKAVADGCTRVLKGIPRFRRMTKQLMKAVWFGRYGVQVKWHWREMDLPLAQAAPVPTLDGALVDRFGGATNPQFSPPPVNQSPGMAPQQPTQRMKAISVRHHAPVNGDKIGYTWDHVPMVSVYPAASHRFPEDMLVTDNLSRSLVLRERAWREQFVIHTYDPDDPDFYYPDMADAVHGVGVRHWLYWSWWTKTEFVTAVADALERYGVGIIAIYYTAGNAAEEVAADKAAKNYSRRTVMKVPRPANGRDSGGIEVIEIPTAGLQVLQALRADCEAREERFIIGQTGSSSSETSGMGTHDTSFMQQTKYDILKDDAEELAETLTGCEDEPGFVWMVQRYTYPWADFPLRLVFNVPDPGAQGRLAAATEFFNMGGKLKEEEVRSTAGFSEPGPEDAVLVNPALALPPGADPSAPPEEEEGGPSYADADQGAGVPYARNGHVLTYAGPVQPTRPTQTGGAAPQIHTPEFKQWFGDWQAAPHLASKVVHPETGEPLRLYHGTNREVDAFSHKARYSPFGFYFTADPGRASNHAGLTGSPNVMPVYLNLRNPLVLSDGWKPKNELEDRAINSPGFTEDERLEWLKSLGYDGLISHSEHSGDEGHSEYIAFHPHQIKSATGNRGTFDPADPRLDYGQGGDPLAYARLGLAAPAGASGGSFAPAGQGVQNPALATSAAAPKSQLSPGAGDPAEAAKQIAKLLPRPEHLAAAAAGKGQAQAIDRNLQKAVHLALGGEGAGWQYAAGSGPADLRHEGMTHVGGAAIRPELDVKHVGNARGVVGSRQDNARNKLAEVAEDPSRLKASLAFRLGADAPEYERGAYLKHGVGGFTARPGQAGVERVLTHREVSAMGTPEGMKAASEKIHAALKNADLEGYHAELEGQRGRMARADSRNAYKTLTSMGGDLADAYEKMHGFRPTKGQLKQLAGLHGYERGGAPLTYDLHDEVAAAAAPVAAPSHPEGRAALAKFKAHLDAHAKRLVPGQAEHYHAAAGAVIGRMTPTAAKRYADSVSKYEFHQSPAHLTRALGKEFSSLKEAADQGREIGGAFMNKAGRLILDGGYHLGSEQLPTHGVYAHEMGHAIDGLHGDRISDKEGWQRAWKNELWDGKISDYARTSPAEGFAEFSRLVHSTRMTPEEIAAHYPQSAAVWKKEGLL